MKKGYLYGIITVLAIVILIQCFLPTRELDHHTSKSHEKQTNLFGKHRNVDTNHVSINVLFSRYSQHQPNNRIKDSKTAVRIAEAMWLSIYGDDIYEELPFNTTLIQDSIWVVTGSLPPDTAGGTLFLMMQTDGKILYLTHEK